MLAREFAFAFEDRYRRAGRPFGISPQTTRILVDGSALRVRYGPWRVSTGLDNITAIAVTGPYAFLKTAGPARLGLTDRGLTFATNSRAGLCLEFRRRIAGIECMGWVTHPNLTLTPADVTGLATLLAGETGLTPLNGSQRPA